MKREDESSSADELAALPDWDRSLWLSRAYLEAAQCLCSSMLEGEFSSQYSSSRVVLHLARQGIELFLKGAIRATGRPPEQLAHNLAALFVAYRECHPELAFYFEVPKRYQVDLNRDLFPELIDPFHKTLDQRHRYATDKKGGTFTTPEVFDPSAVLEEIDELRRELGILEWCELRPKLRGSNAP